MKRPLIAIISNNILIQRQYPAHYSGEMLSHSVAKVCDCLPLIVPSNPDYVDIEALLAHCDGFLFPGGQPNVHPKEYNEPLTEAHGKMDEARDAVALPLIRRLVERGQPFLAVCRGFQEMNVAMGGSLYPEIRDLSGRDNHRMPPDGTLDEKFALRHKVHLTQNGPFAKLFGADVVMTNSLHGQGIKQAGKNIVIDGTAPDGTEEAIYIKGAKGFALGVQWHPEYKADLDPVSKPLFGALGDAARAWQAAK